MYILNEHTSFDSAKMLIEQKDDDKNGKSLYMKGIFIQADIRNRNQRIYPLHEIKSAIDQINEVLGQGYSVCGEVDHPSDMVINMDRVSHMITEMKLDGKDGVGKLKMLPTPCGNIAKTLIENGVKIGVSSRGQGNVDSSGYVSDFSIVTVDLVCTPSAPNAMPTPIWESFNSRRGSIIEDLSRAVNHDDAAQKYLREELLKFINNLK